MDKPIFLVGMPGCGKTTYGRICAEIMGKEFYDLDLITAIERGFRTAGEMIRYKGIEYFRDCETLALIGADQYGDAIIACGGGTFCAEENRRLIKQYGKSVYLKADIYTLFMRLRVDKSERPLIEGMSDEQLLKWIDTTMQEREQYYNLADEIVYV